MGQGGKARGAVGRERQRREGKGEKGKGKGGQREGERGETACPLPPPRSIPAYATALMYTE